MTFLERFAQVAAPHQGLAHARDLTAAGIPSATLGRAHHRGDVTRVLPGVHSRGPLPAWPRYLVTDAGPDHDFVLHVRAHLLARGPGAVVRSRCAAALHGWGLLEDPREVELAVPHGLRAGPGGAVAGGPSRAGVGSGGPGGTSGGARAVAVRRTRTLHVCLLRPVPSTARLQVTTPRSTALDLARELPTRAAVAAVDSALRSGHVGLEELVGARRPGLGPRSRTAAVLQLCDPLAGSVLESCARVDLVVAGLRGFVTQYELRDRAGVMRVDFCWPSDRLVLEVDGARWHAEPAQDRARDNRLAALGYRVVRLTWRQVMDDPRWWEVVARALAESSRS